MRTYTNEELKPYKLKLVDVIPRANASPGYELIYSIESGKKLICSICNKEKEIERIEGIKFGDNPNSGTYHKEYIAICGACAVARKI